MRHVESGVYDEKYFLETDGAGYFLKNKIAPKFTHAVCLSGAAKGDYVLALGCGRGDLLMALAPTKARIIGLDYSESALVVTRKALSGLSPDVQKNITIMNADVARLGFADRKFDFIFMMDIVEHLYLEQLRECFSECYRVLKEDGSLIIHTSPNKLYNDVGYPLWEQRVNKILNNLFRQNLMTRPIRNEMDLKVHVNEQTVESLKEYLSKAGFHPKVWLGAEYVTPVKKETPLTQVMEYCRQILCHVYPLSLFPPLNNLFSNNIWAIAKKES